MGIGNFLAAGAGSPSPSMLRTLPYNPAWDDLYRQYGITPPAPDQAVKPAYAPDVGAGFASSQAALDQYNRELAATKAALYGDPGDLTSGLQQNVYRQQAYMYDPSLYSYEAPDYQATQFGSYDTFRGAEPGQYQKTVYDFADQYRAPDEYQAFDYQAPEIAGVERVAPMAQELWDAQQAAAQEKVGQQYADTRERIKQAAIQTAARPEQMAALEANLGVQEEAARTAAQRELAVQQAQQKIGIGQAEQQLAMQRGLSQATIEQQTQEAQAQEMAKKYGLDVDAARYIVQQQQVQQTAQAAEEQGAYGLNLGRAKELASQQMAQQTAQQGEQRYLTEKEAADAKFILGLKQAQAEARQAEYEKMQQSKYGAAQDVAQTQMAEWQAKNAAKLDYLNAQLQGQQAASQQAAQQATYQTNLTEGERGQQKEDQQKYQAQQQKQQQYQDYVNRQQQRSPITIGYKAKQPTAPTATTAK